jgi:hypothetical protein
MSSIYIAVSKKISLLFRKTEENLMSDIQMRVLFTNGTWMKYSTKLWTGLKWLKTETSFKIL